MDCVADPFAVLGVERGASPEEVTAAYRRLAKRWHPDRAEDRDAVARMAEINGAYDLLRSERWLELRGHPAPGEPAVAAAAAPRALLALTDRRLLWLLDDVPTHRVRSLRLRDVASAQARVRRPLGRTAMLRVRTTAGRRLTFAGLRPATAAAIARG